MPFTRGPTGQQLERFHPIPVISSGIFDVPLSSIALTESAVISAALAVADKNQQSTSSLNPAHARHAMDGSPVDGYEARAHSCLRVRRPHRQATPFERRPKSFLATIHLPGTVISWGA